MAGMRNRVPLLQWFCLHSNLSEESWNHNESEESRSHYSYQSTLTPPSQSTIVKISVLRRVSWKVRNKSSQWEGWKGLKCHLGKADEISFKILDMKAVNFCLHWQKWKCQPRVGSESSWSVGSTIRQSVSKSQSIIKAMWVKLYV